MHAKTHPNMHRYTCAQRTQHRLNPQQPANAHAIHQQTYSFVHAGARLLLPIKWVPDRVGNTNYALSEPPTSHQPGVNELERSLEHFRDRLATVGHGCGWFVVGGCYWVGGFVHVWLLGSTRRTAANGVQIPVQGGQRLLGGTEVAMAACFYYTNTETK